MNQLCFRRVFMCMCECTHACKHVHMCVCVCVYVHARVHACVHACVCVCTCLCVHLLVWNLHDVIHQAHSWKTKFFVPMQAQAAWMCTWSIAACPTSCLTRPVNMEISGWGPQWTSTPKPPTTSFLRVWREPTTPATSLLTTSPCPRELVISFRPEHLLHQQPNLCVRLDYLFLFSFVFVFFISIDVGLSLL